MKILQIRVPENILTRIDEMIKDGNYASRSDFIREAIRQHVYKIDMVKKCDEPKE